MFRTNGFLPSFISTSKFLEIDSPYDSSTNC